MLLAGLGFISPAVLLVLIAAWGYQRYGRLPPVEGILRGGTPVVVAVVTHAKSERCARVRQRLRPIGLPAGSRLYHREVAGIALLVCPRASRLPPVSSSRRLFWSHLAEHCYLGSMRLQQRVVFSTGSTSGPSRC